MWLRDVEPITSPLWQGELAQVSTSEPDAGYSASLESPPVVSIGQPEVWDVRQVYSPGDLNPLIRAKLEESKFYLVRLWCTLRPRPRAAIQQCEFSLTLMPDKSGLQPIAFDAHPAEVTKEVRRDVKVSFNPQLKFQEIEGHILDAQFGMEYSQLQPIITAFGIGEPKLAWTYKPARGLILEGTKCMYVLAKAPRSMASAEGKLTLTADVEGDRFGLPFARPRQEAAPAFLSVQLWGNPDRERTNAT